MKIDTFAAYKQFTALKLHFQTNYDFFRYNGKTRHGWKQFETFKGKSYLHTLQKKYREDFFMYMVHAFAYHDIKWVGELGSPEVAQTFVVHQRNMQSLAYTYERELEELLGKGHTIKEALTCTDDLPLVERNRLKGLTSMETCCILDDIFQYTYKECEHPLWEKTKVIQKFTPFLGLNRSKYMQITKKII